MQLKQEENRETDYDQENRVSGTKHLSEIQKFLWTNSLYSYMHCQILKKGFSNLIQKKKITKDSGPLEKKLQPSLLEKTTTEL